MKPNPTLDKLLARYPETIQAPALKAALEQHKKEKEEADAQRALRLLTSAQTEIESSVSELRAIRKREERQRKVILALNNAMESFMKDGDVEKFEKARFDARSLR